MVANKRDSILFYKKVGAVPVLRGTGKEKLTPWVYFLFHEMVCFLPLTYKMVISKIRKA